MGKNGVGPPPRPPIKEVSTFFTVETVKINVYLAMNLAVCGMAFGTHDILLHVSYSYCMKCLLQSMMLLAKRPEVYRVYLLLSEYSETILKILSYFCTLLTKTAVCSDLLVRNIRHQSLRLNVCLSSLSNLHHLKWKIGTFYAIAH